LDTVYEGSLYRESFAPSCWIASEKPATFQLSHDGETLGEIGAVFAAGQWHYDRKAE
jgi:hypothetical protein